MKTICSQCKHIFWDGYWYGYICRVTFVRELNLVTGEPKITGFKQCKDKNDGNCRDFVFEKKPPFQSIIEIFEKA